MIHITEGHRTGLCLTVIINFNYHDQMKIFKTLYAEYICVSLVRSLDKSAVPGGIVHVKTGYTAAYLGLNLYSVKYMFIYL